jgi:hypothetical protein
MGATLYDLVAIRATFIVICMYVSCCWNGKDSVKEE